MGHTILVVDDTEGILFTAEHVLSQAGYNVALATNGSEALQYLQTHDAPSAIVLDLNMPVMDGWTFLQCQRNDRLLSSVPVIIHSSSAQKTSASSFKSVVAVLSKASLCGDLIGTVNRVTLY